MWFGSLYFIREHHVAACHVGSLDAGIRPSLTILIECIRRHADVSRRRFAADEAGCKGWRQCGLPGHNTESLSWITVNRQPKWQPDLRDKSRPNIRSQAFDHARGSGSSTCRPARRARADNVAKPVGDHDGLFALSSGEAHVVGPMQLGDICNGKTNETQNVFRAVFSGAEID